jgi:hypothetical protein
MYVYLPHPLNNLILTAPHFISSFLNRCCMFFVEGQSCSLLSFRCRLVSNNTYFQVINNSQFHDNERQSAVLLIAKTSEMFRQVTIGPLDTATLQAQFLRSLVEHSQSTCFRPPPHTQHNTNINRGRGHPDIQDPASFSSGSLIQYPANSENSTDDVTTLSYPTTKIDVDVPILDGVTWDEAC